MRLNNDVVIDGEADMTKTPTKGKGVPLQFGGTAGSIVRDPVTHQDDSDKAHNSEPHQNLGTTADVPTKAITTLSEAAEIQAVATLTENLVTFTDQLSRASAADLGLILMCAPMLGLYAVLGAMTW